MIFSATQVDDLFNDSFPDSLRWSAVNNFNGLFGFLRNGYIHALLRTLCVVNVGLQDLVLDFFVREFLTDWAASP